MVTALVDQLFPVGYMAMWPTASPPPGWLLCSGAAIPAGSAYDALRTLIGANTPNMAGRVPGGPGGSLGTTMLGTGGAATVTLDYTQIPSHVHGMTHGHAATNTTDTDVNHVHTFPGGAQVPTYAGAVSGGLGGGLGTAISFTETPSPNLTHHHTVTVAAFTGYTDPLGGGGSHANIQPYTVVNFIIKY